MTTQKPLFGEEPRAELPFVWPSAVDSGDQRLVAVGPYESILASVATLFGVVSAPDNDGVRWLTALLSKCPDCKMRLIVSVYPTCRTVEADMRALLGLAEELPDRVGFRVFAEEALLDRSSNLLCAIDLDGTARLLTGPTENFGFSRPSQSHANLACVLDSATLEVCSRWFDALWGASADLGAENSVVPRLRIPEGDLSAARLWDTYRAASSGLTPAESAFETVLTPGGDGPTKPPDARPVDSITRAIGVPDLDSLALELGRLLQQGRLVTIDKTTRVPPLEAPVRPEWFGVQSFRQSGTVTAQTSMKVAPFDDATQKRLDHLRRASGRLLPRFSFPLADGVRWIPSKAIPLFEAALEKENLEAKKVLGEKIGVDLSAFLDSQRDRIRSDAQRMYEAFQPRQVIPEGTVDDILDELRRRLSKVRDQPLLPKVCYSHVSLGHTRESAWSSQWGQVCSLLIGIAEYPRLVASDRFFLRDIEIDDEALLEAMNVAGASVGVDIGRGKLRERALNELATIKRLAASPAKLREKCDALWILIKQGDSAPASRIADREPREPSK